jgi:hypothetical protein
MSLRLCLRLALLVFAALPAGIASAGDLPTRSVPGAIDGDATRFVGAWSAIRPTVETSNLTCGAPTLIRAEDTDMLVYTDIGGRDTEIGIAAGDGKTFWAEQIPYVSVWTGPDSFLLSPRLADGTLDPARAFLYERCEIWPRKDYEGAVAGAVEPFAGAWSEALPPERGGGRPIVSQVGCDVPTRFEVTGPDRIAQHIEGREPLELKVGTRDGRTIFPNDGYTQTVIWVSPDRWHLHGLNIDGGTDWNLPVIFTRCPAE